MLDGLSSVPAIRHAHVDESQRVRLLGMKRPFQQVKTFLAAIGRIEFDNRPFRLGLITEQ
ncbi:hypothetical protein D3C79_890980 [compost metagenome]